MNSPNPPREALTARALVDAQTAPDIALRRMARIGWKTLPFMKPMWIHIVVILSIGFLMGMLYAALATIAQDVFSNKVLVGAKVQPVQGLLLGVDESYETSSSNLSATTSNTTTQVVSTEEKLTPEQRRTVRNRLFVWFFALGGIGMVISAIVSYYGAWVWANVSQFLRVTIIEKLEYLPLTFHSESRAGDAMYRLQESGQIVNLLQEGIIRPITTLYGLVIAIVFVVAFDPWLLVGVALVFIPMAVLTIYFTPRIRRRSVANRVAHSRLTSRLQETFSTLKVVKANHAEQRVLVDFDQDSHRALDAAIYLRFEMVVLTLLVMLIGTLMVLILEFTMASWVIEQRPTLLGAWAVAFVGFALWNLGAFQSAQSRIDESVGTGYGIVRWWCLIQDMFIGLERAFFLLDLTPTVRDPANPVEYPSPITRVEWENVAFAYDARPVLRDVNLRADVGTITAIVGATGTGKSTLMSLLLRVTDPNAGTMRVNGVDLREMRIRDVRNNCATALQKNILFTSTIAANIRYATLNVSQGDIEAAARVSCADDFIEELDNGYETELGERGSKLSSGQRQRITIARAVVRDAPILILDEPTASLDAETEHEVLQRLSEWGRNKIIFLVTHRLSTIRNADQIAFLDGGRIVELGSHDELMSLPSGAYRNFVEAESVGQVLDAQTDSS